MYSDTVTRRIERVVKPEEGDGMRSGDIVERLYMSPLRAWAHMRKRWHLPIHLWEKVEEIFKSEFSSGRLDGISRILGSSVCVIPKGRGELS